MNDFKSFVRRRVVIIDDNLPILETLTQYLEMQDYEVVAFTDPFFAMQRLEDVAPSVVLTDIKMPGMSGLQVLEAVHRQDEHMPVILMTGNADLSGAIQAVKNGALDFIMKPFDMQYLDISLQRAVRLRAMYAWEKHYVQILEETVKERTASLQDTIAELTVAKQKAEESSRLKSEFLTNITHEVRTPVNGIVGMIELAKSEDDPEEQANYLNLAQASALRLTKLIEGIISFAVVAAEVPEEAVFEPVATAETVVKQFWQSGMTKGVTVDMQVAAEFPRSITGSRRHFSLLLEHLVENAVKFCDAGSVLVDLGVDETKGMLVIKVADTGIGIPADLRGQVLEPFTQVDGSMTRRFEGAGIGLSIVKKIADLQGGEVFIDENPGGGTVVLCTFPAGASQF